MNAVTLIIRPCSMTACLVSGKPGPPVGGVTSERTPECPRAKTLTREEPGLAGEDPMNEMNERFEFRKRRIIP